MPAKKSKQKEDVEATERCPNCDALVPAGARKCFICDAELESKPPEAEEEEPTVKCPNCDALVPASAARCFICDAEFIAQPAGETSIEVSPPPSTEEQTSEVSAEEGTEVAAAPEEEAEQPQEDTLAKEMQLTVDEAEQEPKAEQAVEESEAVAEVEEEVLEEAEQPAEAAEPLEKTVTTVSVRKPYRGLVMAATGGLVYSLILLIFIPLLSSQLATLLLALSALLIVAGANIATKDLAAAAARAKRFSCPLCKEHLSESAKDCPNCGALFTNGR